jgi:dipeptidyl aminopeptidase/acylaminoacyl peptidase
VTSYDSLQMDGEAIYWIEGRAEGDVLVRWTPADGVSDLQVGVTSRVHEYGGGAYLASGGQIWFSDAATQRIIRLGVDGTRIAVTPETTDRYADLRLVRDRLVCVRERHLGGEVINELVSVPADGSEPPQVIASGWDFYSFPRPSPDHRYLAWTCWNAPQMPWDGAVLFLAEIQADGRLSEPVHIAGGTEESVFQPEWSPVGVLHFVSDRIGWWNLYRLDHGGIRPVVECEAELGTAQWEFGYSTYAFLDADTIAVISQQGPENQVQLVREHEVRPLHSLPYTSIKPYLVGSGTQVAFIGSNPSEIPAVLLLDLTPLAVRTLSGDQVARELPWPEPFTFTGTDGGRVHGLLHLPPRSHGSLPLLVKAHSGPTHNAQMRLDPHTQAFVSRGYAVAEVDYRGSTGYGRDYRQALHGRWGQLDAQDCIDAALYLTSAGVADPARMFIWGASAGGYTALRALCLSNVFAAGVARSPVIDPATWRRTAPKFQAHHADLLLGPDPGAAAERSLTRHPDLITERVLIVHGAEDHITPADESAGLANALSGPHQLMILQGEGHYLSASREQEILELELHFVSTVAQG